MTQDFDGFVDRIYEAALFPTIWPSILDELSAATDGNGGSLFAVRDGYVRAVTSEKHTEVMKLFMTGGWSERDQTLTRAYAKNHAGFLTDSDLYSEEELATNEVYRNFYRKYGLDYRAGTIVPVPTGDSLAFVMHHIKPVTTDIVQFLDRLRPHLARASLTANRLGFERARAQAEALQALGLPGAVLREGGRLVTANPLFESYVPSLFQDRRSRLTISIKAADALFGDAISALSAGAVHTVSSIPVSAASDRDPLIVHFVPVRGAARDLFTQSSALLVVTPIDRAAVPTAELLQGLFDLTPAEAKVAHGIGQAHTIEGIAQTIGVGRETIRTQLRAVLEKTGLSRQQELVSLLAGKMIGAADQARSD